MAELIKPWDDGGSLTVAYEGDGDGSAVFSSDPYEGIDRTQKVVFRDGGKTVAVERVVRQEGTRQPFRLAGGGIFRLANGGRFGVLKGGSEPPTPIETYTRLTYIECTGAQYIDLGYLVKEDDIIEADFILTKVESTDHFLFGTASADSGLWFSIYSNTAYVRFGQTTAKSISNVSSKYSVKLQKGQVTIDGTATALDFSAMPDNTLNLFAGRQSDGDPYYRGLYRCTKFLISDSNGLVMDLIPAKKNSDGVIGMLDTVSGTFYTSAQDPFIGGSEIQMASGYELIDYVTINADKIYEACVIKSDHTIEVQWQKASSSGSQYLYGLITSPHSASVTAYIGSSASWRWGKAAGAFATNNTAKHFATVKNGQFKIDVTARTFSTQSFETPDTLIVGGGRDSAGYPFTQYAGKIFFFRVLNGGVPIVDWHPCRRLSDGVEGFWDCVTQTFIEPL